MEIKRSFTFPKSNHNPILKIGFILTLLLLLMVPKFMIDDLIRERNNLAHHIKQEVSRSWGEPLRINGSSLTVPYLKPIIKSGDTTWIKRNLYILPTKSSLNLDIESYTKKRSIYEVILYQAEIEGDIEFDLKSINDIIPSNAQVITGEIELSLLLDNPQYIRETVYVKDKDQKFKMKPGVKDGNVLGNGISTLINMDLNEERKSFSFSFKTSGSESLHFKPIGQQLEINMNADWPSPSFNGSMLPIKSNIHNEGFQAQWISAVYASNIPSYWEEHSYSVNQVNAFSVNLIDPVNHYVMNSRTSKYALLILSLTFGVFFFFEQKNGLKIHPIQYMLVGGSLIIFYLLLISISEHLGFDWAYLIASYATISMIGMYTYFISEGIKKMAVITALLSILFIYIYLLLQMEDFALLAGSIGLFLIMSGAMMITRNFDWYGKGRKKEKAMLSDD